MTSRPSRARATRRERGMVTAELMTIAPLGVAFAFLLLWVVSLGLTQVRLADASRESARMLARGETTESATTMARRHAPGRATIDVRTAGGTVTVTVRTRSSLPIPFFLRCRLAHARVDVGRRTGAAVRRLDDRQRGATTVHAVTVAVLLVIVTLVLVQATSLVRMRHRVAAAADLAALAASRASVAGDDGCRAARDVARRNGARLVACRMDFDVATVTARATSPPWWGGRWATEQRARAAPQTYLGAA
jgi:secretion/DNA translocation related TadE-like protein